MDKIFVAVDSITYPDGAIRPLKIYWDDGRTWDITRVLHISRSADQEFEGIRYTVLIGSAEKNIYRLGSRWYVKPVNVEVNTS